MIRAALILLLAGGVARAQQSEPSFGNPFRFTETSGAAIYGAVCAGCHMVDGRGAVGAATYPSLASDPRLAASAYPIIRVLRGRGAMPPFARTLSDEQVAAVVGFIRTNFDNAFTGDPVPSEVAALR